MHRKPIDYNELITAVTDSVRRVIRQHDHAERGMSRGSPATIEDYQVIASHATRDAGQPLLIAVVLERRPSQHTPGMLIDRFGLTPREAGVASLLREGKSNSAIATELGISSHTTKRHMERILAKLAVTRRAEAVAVLSGSRVHPAPG